MNDRYTPTFNIHEAVRKTLPYMMEMREYFHAHPELSEKEFDTCKTIFQELSLMGIEDVKIIAGTGVTGLIHGALPGPVILLRADIDALPLTEKFDCPYSSLVDGVMHACGHDGHAANLLGVAKILNKHKDCLRGTIRLAFQPAEEGNGGAARMIDAGILNNPRVDYALGLHVAGSLPKGYVGIGRGEISASCDDFTITLHGRGGHGSQPSLCISPIQMGIDIIQSIQNFVYNCHADGDGVVLTFGQFPFSPVCVNDDGVTDRVVHILQDHCSHRVDLVPLKRGSGSEDFAYFSAAVPSSFYYVGVYSDAPVIGHSPEFHWDSNALKYMCETMLTIVYYFESYA